LNPPPIIVNFPPWPHVADHLPLRRRVIKLGGSLLDLRDLIVRLRTWVARQSVAQNYLVVGGGERVEAVRQVRDRWDDQAAHWHCLELMDRNARDVGEVWPGAVVQQRWSEIMAPCRPELPTPPVTLLLAARLLRHLPPGLKPRGELPAGWHVTSDSVAAYLAILLEADELVLLKSTSAQRPTPVQWAADTFVDAYFPQLAGHLPRIAAVNLRHPLGGPPNGV
jgi:aspartokinase-like uncharacterized kinase